MTTQLTKPVTRRVGDFVVTLREDGVELRGHGKQRSVVVGYEEIAKRGLMRVGVALREREWDEPLYSLQKLSYFMRRDRKTIGIDDERENHTA